MTKERETRVLHMLHSLDVEPDGLASTVRNGFKWADAEGARLRLCVCSDRCTGGASCGLTFVEAGVSAAQRYSYPDPDNDDPRSCENCSIQGEGSVVGTWVGRFKAIPAKLIDNEHEERSRQYSGLLASMRKAYPGFEENALVTVLMYRRTK